MRSSYIENDYAATFEAIVRGFKPKVCVELGVLDGYSTIAIGKALKKVSMGGMLDAYDLFDKYAYKHGEIDEVKDRINDAGLHGIVHVWQQDAYTVVANHPPASVDLLHIDISNTGTVFDRMMNLWDGRMAPGGVILFEGGTEARDQVEWMIKYQAAPIRPAIKSNKIVKDNYIYTVFEDFPGLTMLVKRGV